MISSEFSVGFSMYPTTLSRWRTWRKQTTTVGHLKKAIKKEKEHAIGAIDANTLELWKVAYGVDDV
jgi:hypothetical protein